MSSTLMNGPPFVWLNGREILLVQTEGQVRWEAPTRTVHILGDQVDHLAVMSVETGEVRDVTAIPGQPSVRRVEIETPDLVSLPVLLLSDAGVGRARYLVDPRAGKLVESDGIGGDFHLRVTVRPNGETYHQLYHGTELLGAEKGYTSARVSPDGKRVIWAGDWAVELNYYDSQVGRVHPVAKIWSLDSYESLLWFSGEDLRPAPAIRPAPGWREMREPANPDQAGSTKAGQSGPGKPPAAPYEALRPDWGPKRVSQRFAGTAQVVHRFVSRMSYSSGRDPEAERELLAQGRTRAQTDLRALLRELPPSDRFRFMVAFTMYWMGLDPQSSRAVMLEYCPPGNKPGYEEDTIIFLDYAYRKRPDRRLLEGILGWVPQSDGAGAEALASILPDKARSHPRDLLSALKGKPSLLWRRAANLLFDREAESPARAYPELATIADRRNDTLNGLATRLLGEMASTWPSADQWPSSPDYAPGTPAAAGLPFYHLALLTPPLEVRGEWYVPARQFREWLRAGMTLPDDMSSLTLTWRGKSHTWTRDSGRLVFRAGTAFLPIQDIGEAFGERVSLRADGRVIDFGMPEKGRVYAAIPVGWRNPVRPKGLSPDEMDIWWRLLRPNTRSGNVLCEPYNIRVVGQWAAAKIHPLNTVTDDALVLLERRPAGWTILILGTDIPASGRNYGIPAEARKKLGLPF
jgi:hypothetical protein